MQANRSIHMTNDGCVTSIAFGNRQRIAYDATVEYERFAVATHACRRLCFGCHSSSVPACRLNHRKVRSFGRRTSEDRKNAMQIH